MTATGDSVKNPNNEAEIPAPMPESFKGKPGAKGPNTQGDERGRADQHPEGQQAGTTGGPQGGSQSGSQGRK